MNEARASARAPFFLFVILSERSESKDLRLLVLRRHSERSEEPPHFVFACIPLFVIPQRSEGICFCTSCSST
jgi:hypothetical protein